MAEFDAPYYTPMDQEYHNEIQNADTRSDSIEQPIFPISLIGQTVPEVDPSGRNRNMIEGIDAAIRGGAGNIQLVMQVPGQFNPIGGGPKEYGEEVREAIREMQQATGVKVTGVELPTQVNNLTGFSQQGFNEEQRKMALDEVRDAIKFVGDISGGGTVDLVSFEFPRDVKDASWYKEEAKRGFEFIQREKETAMMVDKETGKIIPFDKKDKFYLFYDPKALERGELVKTGNEVHELNWNQVEKVAKLYKDEKTNKNEYFDPNTGEIQTGKFLLDEYQIKKQKEQIEGNMAYYDRILSSEEKEEEDVKKKVERLKELKRGGRNLDELRRKEEELNEEIRRAQRNRTDFSNLMTDLGKLREDINIVGNEKDLTRLNENIPKRVTELKGSINTMRQQMAELEAMKDKYEPINKFGVQKAASTYAEAGIFAMQESQKNQFVQRGKGSISVGPEMGFPQYYGSHPKEWVELILKAREDMVEKITTPGTGYYQKGISEKEASELAKTHIKGELDTAHLGMWLQNFKQELPWGERVAKFKDWYKEQMEYLAEQNKKYDLIGGIQVVDSGSGAHGTLPPGQGVLGKDLFEYMKILKEKGNYKGELTSEGFGEEKFGQGRIISRSWETFNSPIGRGYWGGRAMPQFSDIRHAYAQAAYGTTGIFQSYVPSNDFSLWSQVPLE